MFTFKGRSNVELGVIERNVQHSILPPSEAKLVNLPGRNGAQDFGRVLGVREIKVDITIVANDFEEMRDKVSAVAEWLDSQTLQPLTFSDMPGKTFMARVEGGTELSYEYLIEETTLTFLVPIPFAEGNRTIVDAVANPQFLVNGTYDSYPKVHIKFNATRSNLSMVRSTIQELSPIDFSGKVVGSMVEKAVLFRHLHASTTFQNPITSSIPELNTIDISTLNNVIRGSGTTPALDATTQQYFSIDVVANVEQKLGKSIGNTQAEKVAWVRANVSNLKFKWYGWGLAGTVTRAGLRKWIPTTGSSGNWVYVINHSNGFISLLESDNNSTQITDDGWIHFVAYSNASDGTLLTRLYTDYAELIVSIVDHYDTITVTDSFVSGDSLVIDMETGTVSVNGSVRNHILSIDTDYFPLIPNRQNTIQIPTGGISDCRIEYKPRFLH